MYTCKPPIKICIIINNVVSRTSVHVQNFHAGSNVAASIQMFMSWVSTHAGQNHVMFKHPRVLYSGHYGWYVYTCTQYVKIQIRDTIVYMYVFHNITSQQQTYILHVHTTTVTGQNVDELYLKPNLFKLVSLDYLVLGLGYGYLELIPWMGLALVRISFSLVAASHSLFLYVCGSSGPTGNRTKNKQKDTASLT